MICECGCGLEFEPIRPTRRFFNAEHCVSYHNKLRNRARNGVGARLDKIKPPPRPTRQTNFQADQEQLQLNKMVDERLVNGDKGRQIKGEEFKALAEFYQKEEARRGPVRSAPPTVWY